MYECNTSVVCNVCNACDVVNACNAGKSAACVVTRVRHATHRCGAYLIEHDLWRQVLGRATERPRLRGDHLGDPKIDQFQVALRNKE